MQSRAGGVQSLLVLLTGAWFGIAGHTVIQQAVSWGLMGLFGGGIAVCWVLLLSLHRDLDKEARSRAEDEANRKGIFK